MRFNLKLLYDECKYFAITENFTVFTERNGSNDKTRNCPLNYIYFSFTLTDNTVPQTSASGDLLLATHPSEELASSTLNPDIELTTEQDEGTTEQWFTMTPSTTHDAMGRNPITSSRPVQVLYDENGHEILKQEEVEVKAASKHKQGGSSTVSMKSKTPAKHKTTVAGVSSSTNAPSTSEDVDSTEMLEFTNASEEIPPEHSISSQDGGITDLPSLKNKHTGKVSMTTPSISKSTLELKHASTTTGSLEMSKAATITTESMLPTKQKPHTKVKTTIGTFLTKTPTTAVTKNTEINTPSTLNSQTFPFYTSHTEKFTTVTENRLTNMENGNHVSEDITNVHPKTPTEATIHGEHLLEDYLYENYDYYDDDLYGENYPQQGVSTTIKNTEKFKETVNNHKVTFSSIGTFAALSQKSTPASQTVNPSYHPLETKTSISSTTFSHLVSQKNKFKPTIPTSPQQENFHSNPTTTSGIKPLQKPFLPNILHENHQIGKVPAKKPLVPTTSHETSNIDTRTTTQIPVVEQPQVSTFYPLTDISEEVNIITIDNHRPPTAPLDEPKLSKPTYNPLIITTPESDVKYENTIENGDSNVEINKLSTVEMKPTIDFTLLSDDKTTNDHNNEISDNTAWETKYTTLINNHGVKYPFPTVLIPHTTKDSVDTVSSIDVLSTGSTGNTAQESKFTTLQNNHGVKYPFPTIIIEQTTRDDLVTESSGVKSTFVNTAGQDFTADTTSKSQITDNSITTSVELKPTNTFDYTTTHAKTTPNDLNSITTESQTISTPSDSSTRTRSTNLPSTVYDTIYATNGTKTSNYNRTTPEEDISTTISIDFTDSTPLTTNTPFPITATTEIDLTSADYKQGE